MASRRQLLITKLDSVFSKYIRLRDADTNGMCQCISCGRVFPLNQMDCGHFIPRGHMGTRFDEDNCHAQCVRCNRFMDGNLVEYERRLKRKIGADGIGELNNRANSVKKYYEWELEEMITSYKQECKALEKEKKISCQIW